MGIRLFSLFKVTIQGKLYFFQGRLSFIIYPTYYQYPTVNVKVYFKDFDKFPKFYKEDILDVQFNFRNWA